MSLFGDGLLVCDEAGLIGRERFAADGVRLPSNGSEGVEWPASGLRTRPAGHARGMDAAQERPRARSIRIGQALGDSAAPVCH